MAGSKPVKKGKLVTAPELKTKKKKTKQIIKVLCNSFSSSEKNLHKHFPSNLPDTRCSKSAAEK